MMKSIGAFGLACLLAGCGATVSARVPAQTAVVADAEEVSIPPGHMPPPGECRAWFPGEPPGQQPPAGDCDELEHSTPRGAWLLYRPDSARRVVRVR